MPEDIHGMAASSELTKAFALVGKLPLSCDNVVVPCAIVADLSGDVYGPPAVGQITVPAGGAGLRSEIEISLPQATSVIGAEVWLERVYLQGLVAGSSVQIGPSNGLAAPNVNGDTAWRDIGLRGVPAAVINGKNTAAASVLTDVYRITLGLNNVVEIKLDYKLGLNPTTGLQQGLMVRAGANNQEVRATFLWREKSAR